MASEYDFAKYGPDKKTVKKTFLEAGLVGLMLGWTGAQSFMIRRKKSGVLHLVFLVLGSVLFYGGSIMMKIERPVCDMCPAFTTPYRTPGLFCLILGAIMQIINAGWGFIESLGLLWFALNITTTTNGQSDKK